MRLLKRIGLYIWDFIFYFLGAPYEKQAGRLDDEKAESFFRGPENTKSSHKIYRANKTDANGKVER